MKATYRDLMTVDEFFQAFFQDKAFFTEHGITHIRSASFYFTACDRSGKAVTIYDQNGNEVDGYQTAGCYRPAADRYDNPGGLEPKTVRLTTTRPASRRTGKADKRPCKPG